MRRDFSGTPLCRILCISLAAVLNLFNMYRGDSNKHSAGMRKLLKIMLRCLIYNSFYTHNVHSHIHVEEFETSFRNFFQNFSLFLILLFVLLTVDCPLANSSGA